MAKENDYNSLAFTVLHDLEPVRLRPGMYIGSTDTNGVHHLVWEILDNSIDEAKEGNGKNIYITMHVDGSISIQDEGRGIPAEINKKENTHVFDIVYKTLHGGGKFNDKNYKNAGGLHGVGAAVVNALSTWLDVTTFYKGVQYHCRYTDGGKTRTEIENLGPTTKRGTIVTFMPDPTIFSDITFNYDKIANHIDDSACLCKGVTFHLKDERTNRKQDFYYKDGLAEYFQKHMANKNPLSEVITIEGSSQDIKVEFVGQWFKDDYTERIFSFANGIKTPEGGHHVTGLKKAITNCINAYAMNHKLIKGNKSLEGEDIREGFSCMISVSVPESIIEFEGQTKSKLGTKAAATAVDAVIEKQFSYFLEEHSASSEAIVKKTLDSMAVRQKSKEVREQERKKRDGKDQNMLSGKLTPCSSKQYQLNELFIVEGDSAGGSAKKCRDREHQAVLPLRGKPKNVTDASSAKEFLENKEFYTLISTIGAGYDDEFNLKNIHYDKIIIMTDADDDGAHIQNLLIAFFFQHMRKLLESGHIYIACPPLYRVFDKNKEIYCWTDEELDKARKEFPAGRYSLSRYKGLGEMDADQLGKTTMNKNTRTLIQLQILDADECHDKVDLFLGKDPERRKEWIATNIDFSHKEDHFEEVKRNEK